MVLVRTSRDWYEKRTSTRDRVCRTAYDLLAENKKNSKTTLTIMNESSIRLQAVLHFLLVIITHCSQTIPTYS